MKQLVMLSGKGGTGKTSVTAAFAHLYAQDEDPFSVVIADADVDAANLELVLAPTVVAEEAFWGGKVAVIDRDKCFGCQLCETTCRFDAIHIDDSFYPVVDPIACDGCAACVHQCPEGAITMEEQLAGAWFRSDSSYGPIFHAALRPAQENSGKLVTLVKQQARLLAMDNGDDLVLVDGPPGIGCPVISAVSGASLALIVAEPTASGIHDMQRILQTTAHFDVPTMVCVNKSDVYAEGTAEIIAFCQEQGITVAGTIPYDRTVTEAMVQGQPVTVYQSDAPASEALRLIWSNVAAQLKAQA